MTRRRSSSILAGGAAFMLLLAACGGDETDVTTGTDNGADEGDEGDSDVSGESLTVGGASFTEMVIMQEVYKALLEDVGYDVTTQEADNREIYAEALMSGEIDIVPEYAATFAEYLNVEANGPDAPEDSPLATTDKDETVAAMRPLAEDAGLTVLEPAEASSQNGFAVSQDFAEEHGLETLSDLAELGEPLVFAAVEECPDRPFCKPGLESEYGLEFSEILPLGFGSPQTKEAVADGTADLGLVGTTDGTLEGLGLVLLEDDQELQLADNLVPVMRDEVAEDQQVVDALNELSGVLTTEDLAVLNARVDAERQLPEDVARSYLEEEGLL
ncbi:ABC transporter substrate-binding protein [Actinobacteria bacterium YIM 96077]|uniref:Amino acid ABC transporter substrate-binding protein n=1 Tax=Phytoactinopolyspora halophila TaxID=1981511 RepID=A0A329R0D2_9ACTN|nr:ABC transporter substrate-binding protein [Phytoactinopolyspora halophila]AYY11466.1 ABC transporter substrate-binding protein [Actinobacteria bacterium YIM 96077]RAW18051.1 amino acid ABC transporter substrate-binding protein [Phytoactinopolyspora halophila]